MTPSESLMHDLVSAFPELRPLMTEHLEEQENELLPYLLMADIERWAERESTTDPDHVASITAWLESRFNAGDDELKDLIGVGFVEMVPHTDRRSHPGSTGSLPPPGRDGHGSLPSSKRSLMHRHDLGNRTPHTRPTRTHPRRGCCLGGRRTNDELPAVQLDHWGLNAPTPDDERAWLLGVRDWPTN